MRDVAVSYLQIVKEKIVESFESQKLITTQSLSKEQTKGVTFTVSKFLH